MPLYAFEGLQPQVHPSAFVAPTATLVGDVIVGSDASVWYGVVARGGLGRIIIGDGANVQDGSVLHARCEIAAGATIAHACVVHAATVGEGALIGNGAIVLDNVTIGPRCLIAAGSVVAPGTRIDGGMLVRGVPARVVGEVAGDPKRWVDTSPDFYVALGRRHRDGLSPSVAPGNETGGHQPDNQYDDSE